MVGINFIELFFKASLLVKAVMLLLVTFSIASWTLIIHGTLILKRALKQTINFENKFWSGVNLTQLYQDAGANSLHPVGMEQIFYSGYSAFSRLQAIKGSLSSTVLEAAQRAMQVAFNREFEKLERPIPYLSIIGSISPYIGLLGTVWGIMQAFIALGGVKHATLPMIAPAISEALVATAVGLVAAIPAVLAYNRLSLQLNKIGQRQANFIEEFISIMQRHLLSNQK